MRICCSSKWSGERKLYTKAREIKIRPLLSSKNHVYLLIYFSHALKSLKSDKNLIFLKLKYLDRAASNLSNLYL